MKLNVVPKKEVGMLTEWVNILGGSSTRVSQFMARESLTQIFTKVTNIYANSSVLVLPDWRFAVKTNTFC